MELNKLTVGEIKELQCLLGSPESKKDPCCEKSYGTRIVVLQRGWVVVGNLYKMGQDFTLRNASVIRNWGTDKGLGQIANGGPTANTKLDPSPDIHFHELTVVMAISCKESVWSGKLPQ